MAVPVECEQCQAKYLIDEKFAGKRAKCKRCGFPMLIPLPGEAPQRGAAAASEDEAFAGTGVEAPRVRSVAEWRPQDVVIEREEDVTDIPLAGSGGRGAAGGAAFGPLVPALVLVFVVAVLGLAIKDQVSVVQHAQPSARMSESMRVWTRAVMLLVTFFAIVGPLAMGGFILAARVREFRLLSPAYIRATAIAALPLTLYLVLSALSEGGLSNTFVFFILVVAIGAATFQAIRVIFYLEPLPAAVSGGFALVAGLIGFGAGLWLTAQFLAFVPEAPKKNVRIVRVPSSSGTDSSSIAPADGDPSTRPAEGGPPWDPSQGTGPEGPSGQGAPDVDTGGAGQPPGVGSNAPPGVASRPPPGVASRPPPGVTSRPPPGVDAPSPTEGGKTTPKPAMTRPAAPEDDDEGGDKPVTIFGEGGGGDAAADPAARVRDAGGALVKNVNAVPLPAGAHTILGAPAPSRAFAIVERRTLNEELVELWSGNPPKKKADAPFKIGPQFTANYAISTDGSRLVRIAAFPKLAARVWNVAEARETSSVDLDSKNGTPYLLGFLGPRNDRFLVRWENGARHGLEVWDAKGAKPRRQVVLADHEPSAANQAVSPDGNYFAHAVRVQQANELVLHSLVQNAQPRRIPITALDEQWSIQPAGIAFSPDSSKVAALFVHDGEAVVVVYSVPAGKPMGEVIIPATVNALQTPDGKDPVRSLDWVAGGRAWLVCGTVIVDATNGSLLGDLDATGVVAQAVGDGNTVRLAFAERDKPGSIVTFELDVPKVRPAPKPAAGGGGAAKGARPAGAAAPAR